MQYSDLVNDIQKLSYEMVFPLIPFFLVNFFNMEIKYGVEAAILIEVVSLTVFVLTIFIRQRFKKNASPLGLATAAIARWFLAGAQSTLGMFTYRIAEYVGLGIAEKSTQNLKIHRSAMITGPLLTLFLVIFIEVKTIITISAFVLGCAFLLSLFLKKEKEETYLAQNNLLKTIIPILLVFIFLAFETLSAPLFFLPLFYIAYQTFRILMGKRLANFLRKESSRTTVSIIAIILSLYFLFSSTLLTMHILAFVLLGIFTAMYENG